MASTKNRKRSKKRINPKQELPAKLYWNLSSKQIVIWLFILATFSFIIRVIHIGELSLWVDEYVHIRRSKNWLQGTGPLFADDNNGILYTIFIVPFHALFGVTPFWGRFPSVLFGTTAVLLTYVLGTKLINSYVGYLSSFFMAFSL